jgi:TolB protein
MTFRTITPVIAFALLFIAAVPGAAQVAFISDRGGELGVYAFDTDTAGIRRVTDPGATEYGVTWSHDGRYIYFVRYGKGDQNIWRVRPDGSGLEKLTTAAQKQNLNDISPDGKRMLITSRYENTEGDIVTMDIDGKNARRITNNKFPELGAVYSPDGKTIAVAIQVKPQVDTSWMGNSEIYLYDLNGITLKQLTKTDSTLEALPAFSPNGKKLAYHAFVHHVSSIMVMNLATGKSVNLTKGDGDCRWPRWSADGKWIAYTRRDGKNTDVWVMHPDGTGKRGFIVGPGRDETAAFGPKPVKIPGGK